MNLVTWTETDFVWAVNYVMLKVETAVIIFFFGGGDGLRSGCS